MDSIGLKGLIYLVMSLGWLLIIGCAAHLLAENIAQTLDNQANKIAEAGR
jgi:hypothetical protein